MRRVAAMILLATAFPLCASRGFDQDRYESFVRKLDKFDRELFGCPLIGYPDGSVPRSQFCQKGKGTFDAKLWKQLAKDAPKLFGYPKD